MIRILHSAALALGALLVMPRAASAVILPGVCGDEPIPCDADCALLTGPTCEAACSEEDWLPGCYEGCCGDYGSGWECDWRCYDYCQYMVWLTCYFTCQAGGVVACDGEVVAIDGWVAPCLDLLCEKGYDVQGYTCGGC